MGWLVRLCDYYYYIISLYDGEKRIVQLVADGISFAAELIL